MPRDSDSHSAVPKPPKSGFATDVLKLVTGTTIAQGIAIVIAPLITRLYSPEDFGTLALYSSIAGIVSVVACLRYELAIMLPESNREAANLVAVSLLFPALIALATALVLSVAGKPIVAALKAERLVPYLWLIPVGVFTSGVFTALNYWNSRTRQFGRLSIARVISSSATASATLGFGYAGHATSGVLIGASVGGQTISTAILGGQIWRDDHKVFLESVRWQAMLSGIRRFQRFPKYDTWAALLNAIAGQIPTVLLSAFFSPAAVGFYALGQRVLGMPMSLVGSAVGQVFFQRAAVAQHDQSVGVVAEAVFRRLVSLSVCPFLLLMLIGPDVFAWVFGSQWRDAGLYASILSAWILVQFTNSPLTTLFSVLERQRASLLFNIAMALTRVSSLVVGGIAGSIVLALSLFTLSALAVDLGRLFYTLSRAGVRSALIFLHLAGTVSLSLLLLAPALAILLLSLGPPSTVIVAGVLGTAAYYLIILRRDREIVGFLNGLAPWRKG